MKNNFLLILSFLILLSTNLFSQEESQNEIITVVGDSLIGKRVNGEMIREVYGNVVLTQGDITITCNQAIQFISKNEAELIGDVIAIQDSITIRTPHGFYYGDEKVAESNSGVTLDDKKVILSADSGKYYFDEDKAFFQTNVRLFDTTSTLTSNELTYFNNENRSIAVGNVMIVETQNIIYADSLEHFREKRITFADDNVRIVNRENNVTIFGDHLEDYAERFYTLIDENPLFMQIDTTYVNELDTLDSGKIDTIKTTKLDTLIIKSLLMESYRDTISKFEAKDSVKIWRGEFASVNDYTIYYKNDEKIITELTDPKGNKPVIWSGNTQLSGDSISIYLRDNNIRLLDVFKHAFILTQNENYKKRYDQISGDQFSIYFDDNNISKVDVEGSVFSIYFLYEDDEPNGLTKSSSKTASIEFEDQQVSVVKLYGQPTSEFYPEPQVMGKEFTFTLPRFILYENRPKKEDLLESISIEENKIKNTNNKENVWQQL